MPLRLAEPRIIELPPLKLPFWRYFEIFRGQPYAFLFDSALESERQGRYSFLGGDPFLVFQAKRRKAKRPSPLADCTTIEFWDSYGNTREKPKLTKKRQDPFAALRELLDAYHLDSAVCAPASGSILERGRGIFRLRNGPSVGRFS